jgi:hypothetical protein
LVSPTQWSKYKIEQGRKTADEVRERYMAKKKQPARKRGIPDGVDMVLAPDEPLLLGKDKPRRTETTYHLVTDVESDELWHYVEVPHDGVDQINPYANDVDYECEDQEGNDQEDDDDEGPQNPERVQRIHGSTNLDTLRW